MSDSEIPQPDKVEGAPHPRETVRLFGQDKAEQDFLAAYNAGRLHHGWLLTGPKGLGKATLAWRIARFLLATPEPSDDGLFGAPPPPDTLEISPDHPVAHRVQALSDPGLFLLRRAWDDKAKRHKTQLTVDEVRRLKNFFSLSSAEGGRRVVIVDCMDELNVSAANAILKLLEEPPARTTMLLIAHQPSRLLPTIRSRCRELRLAPLDAEDMARALGQAGAEVATEDAQALAALSSGSVGAAIRLLNFDGLALYAQIVRLLDTLPRLDRAGAIALGESVAGKTNEPRLELLLTLMDTLLGRLARTGVMGTPPMPEAAPGEAAMLSRLAPDAASGRAWAEIAQQAGDRARHARAVNVDPAALVLDMILQLRKVA
ncbi:MAG: DNA polymerase III subunit delta' [Rhodobacteraceae bacterium]|jgi:DNA polymerase-3 subunit delta'|uniref:DNA polymerase III, delta prime subunit n=1 Tax=Salipiger profundus TaxID=1229727 RepID=A0A1U7D7D0_9RHOB|nr:MULTISPECIES: DNA polymerase III subunit delta' [Salipiger]APX24077.1 DNA polymerase III, delta prime subunit [Salipiger profundus]MAB06869.1 DNA polymerase III subunit delta' [Paracoccaceae bacterium]GFZ94501.1 DNA polymerase III subunit delta' [Salipiger profundus]SFB91821.1 DNA polymerase-3 subunit delta' [Salipiger profundus]